MPASPTARSPSPGFNGASVLKVPVDDLRNELKSRGFLDTKDTGGLTTRAKTYFNRAKADLISTPHPRLIECEGYIWR